ncbi:type II toxin-antitoxin system PemK/MazF family toxin [Ferroplasma sp.]|uniref:type II toxin-antitoxin system PemK/MazF family toxin n=1 Tax=Ferroplasma sp. TaxID=2591003 RepID=UPI002630709B|nr:type II toxin-antitoxin system PemK/MazF family toxin [Ferroplasma sp.]MCL4453292.1 type II toxin-antitoxin system PemK/MazF family toxin [Candidatus Thermoplasmatota archaeon]
MPEPGDVVITRVKFTDSDDSKIRPALILFEEWGNVIIAGITTNTRMNGIPISRSDGAAQDSVIKLNYIFTITNEAIIKTVFHLSGEKRNLVFDELSKKFSALKYD